MSVPQWSRTTTTVDEATLPAEVRAALQRAAERHGIAKLEGGLIAWTTESVESKKGLFKRPKTVHTAGVLTPAVLAWTIAEGDDAPNALVVRLDDAEITEQLPLPANMSPEMRAAFEQSNDGLHVRADLGHPERGTVFLPLGTDTAAMTVRAAILERWHAVRG